MTALCLTVSFSQCEGGPEQDADRMSDGLSFPSVLVWPVVMSFLGSSDTNDYLWLTNQIENNEVTSGSEAGE